MSLRDDAIEVYESRKIGPCLVDDAECRLAYHVLRETDPSPVTEEHLRERGFVYKETTDDWEREGVPGYVHFNHGFEWWTGKANVPITSIGQLDTLLRGLLGA